MAIESKVLKDAGASGYASYRDVAMQGRDYTWSNGETLPELLERRDEILKKHAEAMARAAKSRRNLPLVAQVLSGALTRMTTATRVWCAPSSIRCRAGHRT